MSICVYFLLVFPPISAIAQNGKDAKNVSANECLEKAKNRFDAMQNFANEGLMIPEQIWDKPTNNKNLKIGEGVGSATPLAWSMAQFIRLAVNLQKGRNLDTPEVVARRYGNLK